MEPRLVLSQLFDTGRREGWLASDPRWVLSSYQIQPLNAHFSEPFVETRAAPGVLMSTLPSFKQTPHLVSLYPCGQVEYLHFCQTRPDGFSLGCAALPSVLITASNPAGAAGRGLDVSMDVVVASAGATSAAVVPGTSTRKGAVHDGGGSEFAGTAGLHAATAADCAATTYAATGSVGAAAIPSRSCRHTANPVIDRVEDPMLGKLRATTFSCRTTPGNKGASAAHGRRR
ncbi:hypothetical protein C8R45DRAFT_593328 [Mycena sanguinolenta]|nr:hypothetical protein C8R45DRAFT_593328 [Mycena sanguinolenta]